MQKSKKCKICKKMSKDMVYEINGGKVSRCCGPCFEKKEKKEESWVAKNIREAKERREKGESPWSNIINQS